MYEEILALSKEITLLEGGFSLGSNCYLLNSEGGVLYKVSLGTGTMYNVVFFADATYDSAAVDRVVDFCEDNELKGLYSTYEDLIEEAERDDEEIEDYIETSNLVSCGNSGHYIDLQGLEEIISK